MSLKVGIIGLPNAGKSTLFNALVLGSKAAVGEYPFTTIDKNIGVSEVPDKALFSLAKKEGIEKITPATVIFLDIAGLIKGAHLGEGLGNEFLHHIREVDLILHVVRFFKDGDIPHVHQKLDPEDDLEIVNDELILADLATVEKRLNQGKPTQDEKEVLKVFFDKLDKGILASEIVSEEDLQYILPLQLLTLKKQLIVGNISEEDLKKPPKKLKGFEVIPICAKLEAELTELSDMEEKEFMKEYGMRILAKDKIIAHSYKALDLITFYTIAKRKEARAHPAKTGLTALQAAGVIHSDFAKKFIKAQVLNVSQLLDLGSWQRVKETGKLKLVGKDYLIQDGDVIEFLIGN